MDLWLWTSKAAAEEALADTSKTPLFEEWGSLVEMVKFEWAAVIADH